MNLHGRKLCDNCFKEIKGEPCTFCGYKKSKYKPDIGILPVGTVLHKNYIVGQTIGKGGFGVTYKAHDMIRGRVIAVKEYYPNGIAHRDTGKTLVSVSDEKQRDTFTSGAEKFYEEAKTVSRFNGNPNIVDVYEVFHENDTVYFSMEYLEGKDLKQILKEKGKLDQEEMLYILDKVTDALVITHSLNVLHRDISPDNIYVENDGTVKLIDFGAARQVIAEQSRSLSVILKQGFAPLEQYQRRGKQGPWTDIYALGATMYYCLTGNIPYDSTERIDMPSIGTAEEFRIDEKFWKIIEKCMEVRIDNRYQSVIELKSALKELDIVPKPIKWGMIPSVSEEIEGNVGKTVAVSNQISENTIGETVAVSSQTSENTIGETVAVSSQTSENTIGETVAVSSQTSKNTIGETVAVSNKVKESSIGETIAISNSGESIEKKEFDIKKFLIPGVGLLAIIVLIIIILVVSCSGDKSGSNNGANGNSGVVKESSGEDSTIETTEEQKDESTTIDETSLDENTSSDVIATDDTTTDEQTTIDASTEETTTKEVTTKETTTKPTTTKPTTTKPTTTKPTTTKKEETTTKSNYVEGKQYTITAFGQTHTGKYTGDWVDGKPNGNGKFVGDTIPSNDTQEEAVYYSGSWTNGIFNGKGTLAYAGIGAGTAEEGAYTVIDFNNKDWSGYDYCTIYYNCTWKNGNEDGKVTIYGGSSGYYGIPGNCEVLDAEDGIWIGVPELTEWDYILQLP